MGESWPLTVDAGCLYCDRARAVIFVHEGTSYAVNGAANQEYTRIDPIWAEDPSEYVPRRSIGPLIQRGVQLCE